MRAILPISDDEAERFRALIGRAENGCWPWLGIKDARGYGRFCLHKKMLVTSRISWALANGKEPDGFVCHSCDNPPCVNPAHLWVGTGQDNCRDASDKGRLFGQDKTHCPRGHPYSPENTRRFGYNSRACLTCKVIHSARWREKNRERSRLIARATRAAAKAARAALKASS